MSGAALLWSGTVRRPMRIHSAPMAKKMMTLTPKGEVQRKGSVIMPLSLWRRCGGIFEAAERPRDEPPGRLFDSISNAFRRSWPGRLHRVVRRMCMLGMLGVLDPLQLLQ